jgi:hypothetical protein
VEDPSSSQHCQKAKKSAPKTTASVKRYRFKLVNFAAIADERDAVNLCSLFFYIAVDQCMDLFYDTVWSCFERHVPTKYSGSDLKLP